MSDNSAIRMLQAAIENVRVTCTGSEYKNLLAACDAADSACEKALGEPDDSQADKREEQQPKNLKQAAVKARVAFGQMRTSKNQNAGVPDEADDTK